MLKEAIQKMIDEGDIPLVWDRKLPYVAQNRFNKNVRNDGKDPVENEEEDDFLDDEETIAMDNDEEMGFDEEGFEDIDGEGDFSELDDEDDPDRQGLIRVVPNAHLVYKRAAEDGTFEELWIYNTGDSFEPELETRRAILAGTDIPANRMHSEDGSQKYSIWTAGNGQILHITGLPS
jgi:hypothetical protein